MRRKIERDGVFQRNDRRGWWVSFIDANGRRRKQKVAGSTRTQALAALSGLKMQVERDKILGVRAASEITTEELLARYKRYQKTRLRQTSLERLDGILSILKAALPQRAKDITRKVVSDFISSRAGVVAAGTIQKEVAVLKHALRLAIEWELLPNNPATGAKLPKIPQGRTRYLSPVELRAALQAAPEWMRVPLALAAFTGMRRGELLGLRWGDVDLFNRRAYLRETKNGSLRIVPLNDMAFQLFANLPQNSPGDLVLAGVDGQKLSVQTRRLFKKLGIEGASFHSLRHTAASWLVMQGVDLYAVGQLLGHRTPRMTQRYAHLSPGYMAGAVGKLDAVFNDVLPDSSKKEASLVPTASPSPGPARVMTGKLLQ